MPKRRIVITALAVAGTVVAAGGAMIAGGGAVLSSCCPTALAGGASVIAGPAQRWTPAEISTDQYESSPAFTPDGRELYYMLSDRRFEHYRLMWSRCEQGRWSAPQPAPFAAPPPVQEADPFVTDDGRRLYFVSSRHDPAGDDLDIWFVERNPHGHWGAAQRLPAPVNSPGAELWPRVAAAGGILFGSNRGGGHGGGDIYFATPQRDGWRVRNLGPPVSTAADEYEAEISRDGRVLVVVADRGDRSHLYRYERGAEGWVERERIAAARDVFQVGPLLSPLGDRLLFAQADGQRSGELFLIDLATQPSDGWPPRCGR